MSIQVDHRGYTIRYSDNGDEWTCYDVQNARGQSYSSPKLSAVKAAIDKMLLDARKKSAFPCFELGQYGGGMFGAKMTPVSIIEYVERKIDRDYYRKKPDVIKHIVAAIGKRDDNERATRRNGEITDFMPDTPEARAAFDAYVTARERARKAEKEAQEAFKAIPRMTIDMISDLVRIAESGRDSKDEPRP